MSQSAKTITGDKQNPGHTKVCPQASGLHAIELFSGLIKLEP